MIIHVINKSAMCENTRWGDMWISTLAQTNSVEVLMAWKTICSPAWFIRAMPISMSSLMLFLP